MPRLLIIDTTSGDIRQTAEELDDDTLQEVIDGDSRVVQFEDGVFKQLNPMTAGYEEVEEC